MDSAISVKNVFKTYGKNPVLKDINIDIKKGEFVCLLGPSGCGKSTLLRLIAGLDTPVNGEIFLGGKDATFTPPSKRNFGIMFQSYALFPNLTAFENVAYGLRSKKMKSSVVNEIVNRYFEMVGLTYAKDRYPAQLSGGEQQRVALARALAISPDFLLLDEPLSALDAKVRHKLRREICNIQKELNLTTIMVTHDQDEALTMADRIIVMNRAEIMQIGTPIEVYENPANKFVADFIGAINFYEDFDNQTNLHAVRPENITLDREHSDESIKVVVKGIEFRGNFCRISTGLTHGHRNDEFIVDTPLKQSKELNLQVGEHAYLKLPSDNILSFVS